MTSKDQILAEIQTAPKKVYATNVRLNRVVTGIEDAFADAGGVDFIPDFQRGHVWIPEQQLSYIESMLRGYLPQNLLTLQFNCPHWIDPNYRSPDLPLVVQCVDGLQRYTAMKGYVEGKIKPFGLTYSELEGTKFDSRGYHVDVVVHAFKIKREVLDYYLNMNQGSTPHTVEELSRIQAMKENCQF